MNPYHILGVPANADAIDIKLAYRQKAQALHPDKENGDHEAFADLQWAYDILKDEEKRKQFDATGKVEDRQPSIEDMATSEILQAFQQWLGGVMQGQIHPSSDCISDITIAFQNAIGTCERDHNTVKGQLTKINKMIGKFKCDESEENVLEGHLGSVKMTLENNISNIEKKTTILKEAVTQLTHFTYSPDGGLVSQRPTQTTTSTNAWG